MAESASSNPSRRAFLGAAGALGVAGAAFQVMPASAAEVTRTFRGKDAAEAAKAVAAAPAATQTPIQSFAGASRGAFAAMLSDPPVITPAPTAVRWYMDAVTYPNTTGYSTFNWPNITTQYGSPAHALVSIRPDIAMLNAGAFDADLSAFMVSAPGGPASLLTIWHEAATFNLSNPNYPQDSASFITALTHLQKLASGKIPPYPSTDVRIGVIDVNPSALPLKKYPSKPTDAQDVYNLWMAANLDWYGCDLYDNANFDLSAFGELNAFRTCINNLPGSVAGADWPVNIPEINSAVVSDTVSTNPVTTNSPTGYRRSDFFHFAWAWLQTIGPASHLSGLLGFWNGPGNEGSPWPPADLPAGSLAAMITELEAQNGNSAP